IKFFFRTVKPNLPAKIVMRGLVPRVHDYLLCNKGADGRNSALGRPGHDDDNKISCTVSSKIVLCCPPTRNRRMKWSTLEEEQCPVARTVAVIGDRWTLLVLRDCFLRVRRFEEFQARLGVTRHVLADRLKKLVRYGVLRRVPYQERPKRYEYLLTQKGLDL